MFLSYPFLPRDAAQAGQRAAAPGRDAHIALMTGDTEAPALVLRADRDPPCEIDRLAANFSAYLNGRLPLYYLAPEYSLRMIPGSEPLQFAFHHAKAPSGAVCIVTVTALPGFERLLDVSAVHYPVELEAFVQAVGKVERRSPKRLEEDQAALLKFFTALVPAADGQP